MTKQLKALYRFLSPKFQGLFLEYPVAFQPRYGHGRPPHPELEALIAAGRPGYEALIGEILARRGQLWQIQPASAERDPLRPAWNNGFLPGLDLAALYALVAHFQPRRYVEVGSGNSTKTAALAIRDQQLPTRIVSIDPHPRAEIDALAHEIVRQPFESLRRDLPAELEAGDMLFIDNSHRILPNSDAMVFFLEVLPRLRPGVIVHIHDVYLPYDYPQFMCDRFYSEQYGLALCLLSNPGRYVPLLPAYFLSEDAALSAQLAPLWEGPSLRGVERHGGSFWLRIGEG